MTNATMEDPWRSTDTSRDVLSVLPGAMWHEFAIQPCSTHVTTLDCPMADAVAETRLLDVAICGVTTGFRSHLQSVHESRTGVRNVVAPYGRISSDVRMTATSMERVDHSADRLPQGVLISGRDGVHRNASRSARQRTFHYLEFVEFGVEFSYDRAPGHGGIRLTSKSTTRRFIGTFTDPTQAARQA